MSAYALVVDTMHAVESRVSQRFYGWECVTCGGPLRLNDWAARALTGDGSEPIHGQPLVHDTKSDFYWVQP